MAIVGWHGTSMLCYVTPKEHLGLPTAEDVKQGLVAYRIAAHAADLPRGNRRAAQWDRELSQSRFDFDWRRQFELALDPETAQAMHDETLADDYFNTAELCSMCGPKYWPMHNFRDVDWGAVQAVIAERKEQRAAGLAQDMAQPPGAAEIDERLVCTYERGTAHEPIAQ